MVEDISAEKKVDIKTLTHLHADVGKKQNTKKMC